MGTDFIFLLLLSFEMIKLFLILAYMTQIFTSVTSRRNLIIRVDSANAVGGPCSILPELICNSEDKAVQCDKVDYCTENNLGAYKNKGRNLIIRVDSANAVGGPCSILPELICNSEERAV